MRLSLMKSILLPLFFAMCLTACTSGTAQINNRELADKQTSHPEPPKALYDQRQVSILVLNYEQKLNQCRAKLGFDQ